MNAATGRSGDGSAGWAGALYRLRLGDALPAVERRDLVVAFQRDGLPWLLFLLGAASLVSMASLWADGATGQELAWALAALAVTVAGWGLYGLGRLWPPGGRVGTDAWAAVLTLFGLAAGLVWGGGFLAVAGRGHSDLEVALGVVVVGLLAGVAALGRHLLGVVVGFVVPAAAGTVYALARSEPTTLHDGLVFMVLLLAGVFLALAHQAQARTLSFRQQIEAARALIARLEAADGRHRLFLSHGAAGFLALDSDGRMLEHTSGVQRMLGYRGGALYGLGLGDLVHPGEGERLRRVLAECVLNATASITDLRLRHEDGSWRHVSLHLRRALMESRRAGGDVQPVVVATLQDASDYHDVIQAQRRTRDRAEASVRAKDAFLAVMSHEIRTPMAGIIGLIDLLKETSLDPKQGEYVAALDRAGAHLSDLLNDILDLSRIDAGKLHIERAVFDLRKVLGGVLDIFRARAATKGLTLRARVAGDLPRHWSGDERHLRQVLANLVGNAVKFTHTGWVEVRITAPEPPAQWDGARVILRVEVEDSGPGIAPEHLETLFDPFSPATQDAGGGVSHPAHGSPHASAGSGLGLAISRRLVGAMGGELSVRSAPGTGSVFTFTLPLDVASADAVAAFDRATAAAGAAERDGRAMRFAGRVLVVDDSELNRLVLRDMLSGLGLEVDLCEDGAAAVSAFRRIAYDLVILDMQMPGVDGFAAATAIRALEKARDGSHAAAGAGGRRCPILALSAGVTKEDRDRAIGAGCDGYAVKPLRRDAVVSLLAMILPGTALAGEAPVGEISPGPAMTGGRADSLSALPGAGPPAGHRAGPLAAPDQISAQTAALLPSFFRHLEADTQSLRLAVEADDRGVALRAAHTAKGNAMLFGFRGLTDALGALEAACADAGRPLAGLLARVEAEADALRDRARDLPPPPPVRGTAP